MKKISTSSDNRGMATQPGTNKKLPDNFFENVLDLEFKIRKNFSLTTLQEIINLYSVPF